MITYVYGFKDSCGSGFKAGLSYLSNNSFLFPFPLENFRLLNSSVIIDISAFSSENLEKTRPFNLIRKVFLKLDTNNFVITLFSF